MSDFAEGTVIDDRYKLVSRLGSGGMADVYLAEDGQLGRKVAVKLLYRRFAEDPGFVERFRREAQAAAGLQHPNIVSVYDRGAYDGTYYIAMEYLPGRSLKQLIRSEAPLEPLRAIDVTTQILKAARFAHRHGVIHRDLKPHNVIIDDSDQAKVTDFGIARAGASDMTETGSIMGTAQYLSPEQAQGHAVSGTSDLYSIGIVLYEMLTGHVPFDAESAVTIALKHVSETPSAPTRSNASISPELEQVVMWALSKNPSDRPQDADQFIDALEFAKKAIESGASGERTAAMAAVAGVSAYRAGAATATVTAPATDVIDGNGNGGVPLLHGSPPEEPERRRSRWPWIALLLVLLLTGGGVAAYLLTRPAKVLVPDVVRQQLGTASTILGNAGFNVSTIDVPSRAQAGLVIRQAPASGVKADKGSTVTLTVSSGPGQVNVPAVENLTPNQAKQVLKTAGLKVGTTSQQSSDQVATGAVVGSVPGAGQTVQVGSSVELIVSSGKAPVNVPDVTTQSQATATATLQNQGFKVSSTTATSTTVQPGNVISQTPAGGSQATPGSTVTLVIATAPTTTSVPDVRGKNAVVATSALVGAGFQVTSKNRTVSDPTQDGVVQSQSPSPGSQQKKGSNVTLVVGHYQQPAGPTGTTGTTGATGATTPTPTTTTSG